MGALVAEEDEWYHYPNTCENCESRGQFRTRPGEKPIYHGSTLPEDWDDERKRRWRIDRYHVHDFIWQNEVWPERCKPCNARAQAYKRARASINRLEELRQMIQDSFTALGRSGERWCYLKFVTLTWKNELSESESPDMKAARRWLRRKRDKIIDKLDCLAGTDVMECVTKKVDDKYHHHVHMHGIWIMPYHDIEYVGEIMRKYVGRDQCRAVKPVWVENPSHPDGGYTISAFSQARNYLIKYLTKEPNTRRSLWGFARKGLDPDQFYGQITRIYDKWSTNSS